MKLKIVDTRESLVRDKVVRTYSFVVLRDNQTGPADAQAEVRLTDATADGINPNWRVGQEVEVT